MLRVRIMNNEDSIAKRGWEGEWERIGILSRWTRNGLKQLKLIQRARYRRFCLLESEAYNGLIYTWEIIISNSVYTGLTEVHPRPASTSDCRGCFDGSQWNLGLHCSLCANPYFLPRLLTSFTDRGTTFAGAVNAAARSLRYMFYY